jgi:acyl carrier protein
MSRDEIEVKVHAIAREYLGLGESDVPLQPDASLAGMGADSLDRLELQLALEEAFEIEISDSDGEEAATLGAIIAMVERKLAVTA